MASVYDIKFNRPNRVYKAGDLTKKNEAPDGYLAELKSITTEQIQANLNDQIKHPLESGNFEDRTITKGIIEPLDYEDPLFDRQIINQ